MKAKILTTAVLLVTSVSLFGDDSVFIGRVISIALGGGEGVLFVEPSGYDNTSGGMHPKPTTTVYIYANFGNAGNGDKFKFMGEYIGQVQYRTAIGEMATVSRYTNTNSSRSNELCGTYE